MMPTIVLSAGLAKDGWMELSPIVEGGGLRLVGVGVKIRRKDVDQLQLELPW